MTVDSEIIVKDSFQGKAYIHFLLDLHIGRMSSIPRPSDRLSFESKTFFSTVCSSTGTTLSSGPLTRFLSIVNQTKGGIGWSKKLLKATFFIFCLLKEVTWSSFLAGKARAGMGGN